MSVRVVPDELIAHADLLNVTYRKTLPINHPPEHTILKWAVLVSI